MQKLRQNLWVKAGTESWWLNPNNFFYLLLLFLPTQLGKHFWPIFSYVFGSRIDYLAPVVYVTDIIALGLFLEVILKRKIHAVSPLFSLYILFISVSVFLSPSPLVGWYFLLKLLEMSFIAWYVFQMSFSKRIAGIAVFVGIVFESILALMQILNQRSLGGLLYLFGERMFNGSTPGIANASISGQLILRPYGTFSHPNMLGGYFVIAMLLIIFFLRKEKGAFQICMFLSLIFGTLGLTLSLSRTALVAWGLIGCIAVSIQFKRKISKIFLFSSLLVLTTFILSVVFFPLVISRLLTFPFDQSFTERSSLAKTAFVMMASHPLFGVGPNNFISQIPYFSKNEFTLQPVHNIYLLIATELGIPGFLIAFGFLSSLAINVHRYWKQSIVEEKKSLLPLVLALFAILFSGFFDHYFLTLQQGQLLVAVCIGLILKTISQSHATIRK